MMNLCKLTLAALALMPAASLAVAAEQPKSASAGCICMEVYLPVCGALANGGRKTFSNACFAKCANAKIVHEGPC
jgi:hypothetical protein